MLRLGLPLFPAVQATAQAAIAAMQRLNGPPSSSHWEVSSTDQWVASRFEIEVTHMVATNDAVLASCGNAA